LCIKKAGEKRNRVIKCTMHVSPSAFCVALWLFTATVILAADLSVNITGFRHDQGLCLVSLFSSAGGFPSEHESAMQSRIMKAAVAGLTVTFTNLPPGKYALSVCHDENGNGKMDSRSLGRPAEGYALFLPQESRLGPPRFNRSVFEAGTNDLTIAVKLEYPPK
jgi:uncharacterized protein (DUF2141 family)